MQNFEKGKTFLKNVESHFKTVSDSVKQSADNLLSYADEKSPSIRRLAEIKAIHTEWQNAVADNNQKTQLYQVLLSREIAKNQDFTNVVNDILIKNYYELNNFLCIPNDETIMPLSSDLQYTDIIPVTLKEKNIAIISTLGGTAVGTTAYAGALALMTLLGSASTGTALSSLSGAAYWSATLAAFGGGSLAAGGFGMAGGAIVLGGLFAVPAIAGSYYFADHYTEKAYQDALKLKKDTVVFRRNAAAYYAKCEQQLDILQKINSGLSSFIAFFNSMLNMSFAAESMPDNDEYFSVYQQAARTLIIYARLSPVTKSGHLNIDAESDLQKAERFFKETQDAYFSFRAKTSEPYRKLLDKLAANASFTDEKKLYDITINDLKKALSEERAATEKQIELLLKEKKKLQSAADENGVFKEQITFLNNSKQAIEHKFLFQEKRYKKFIAEKEIALRQSEKKLQANKAALQKTKSKADHFRELFYSLKKEQEDAFLSKRAAFQNLYFELELNYINFGKDTINVLASGEYLLWMNKEQRLDFSAIAIYYGVALEGIMKKVFHWRGITFPPEADLNNITLGSYCYFASALNEHFENGFFPILRRITKIRNNAAHYSGGISRAEIDIAHDLLFETTSITGYKGLFDYLNSLLN